MDFKKLIEKFKKLSLNKQLTNIVIVILVGILIIIAASAFKDSTGINTSKNQKENTVSSDSTNNGDNSTDGSNSSSSDDSYENDQETKLKNILENIDGVGAVQVMIYYDRGEEQVPAYNQNNSSSVTSEDDNSGGKRTTTQNSIGTNVVVTTNGDKTEPLIINKYKPKVTGIFITAEGADNSDIKLDITNSVAEFFNIPVDKVNVYPMKK